MALFHKANLFQVSFFLVTYVNIFVYGMVILNFTTAIHVKADDFVRRSKLEGGENASYFRKVRKSFRPLRLEFGNNYVDRSTPLVMQEFCIRQTASLVLLIRI